MENNKNRSVAAILYAHPFDMGGMPIRQPFPTNKVEQIDPFILLHHAVVEIPKESDPKHTGVGPHPHRGFSPVTFIFEGGVHHQDSRGNNNTIYKGGIQWMNAGMGIIHSERPPVDIQAIGGKQEIIHFGSKGVKGSPKKEGESEAYKARREAWYARHRKNIDRGPSSAAWWAAKTKW
jgi:redox-sensitive bicupin YhaK (pirin superfamily)